MSDDKTPRNGFKYIPEGLFSSRLFCAAAIELVQHDEVIRALQLLDNIPAYYREHVPDDIRDLKRYIRSKILTVYDIQGNSWDSPLDASYKDHKFEHQVNNTTRGLIVKAQIEAYNAKEIVPHLIDLGPGPYHYPIGLKNLGLKFSYESLNINKKAEAEARLILGDEIYRAPKPEQPLIFMACEIIEHLFNESDIRYSFDKVAINKMPEVVVLSTPAYDYGQGKSNWLSEGLSHLRAYTPNEFVRTVTDMFPEYVFHMGSEWIVTLVGTLKQDLPKPHETT